VLAAMLSQTTAALPRSFSRWWSSNSRRTIARSSAWFAYAPSPPARVLA
jgi:hypothetical protein